MLYIYYLLILFLCFNNLLLAFTLSSSLDIFRIPIQFLLTGALILQLLKKNKRNSHISVPFVMLIVVFIIYIVCQLLLFSNNILNEFSDSTFGLIVLLLFYIIPFKKTKEIEQKFKSASYIFLVLSSVLFLYSKSPLFHVSLKMYQWPLFLNSIYYIICIIPFCLLFSKRTKQSLVMFGLSLICVLLSNKQGAFIALLLSIICYFVINRHRINSSNILPFIFGIVFLYIIGSFAYNFGLGMSGKDIDMLKGFSSMEKDGGSGRLDIYNMVLSLVNNSGISNILFGHGGVNAVAKDIGISAHNDFLEILYDFGLMGFLLYLIMIGYLIKTFLKSLKQHSFIAPSFGASILIFLTMSAVSHVMFILKYSLLLFSFWGITIRIIQNEKTKDCFNSSSSIANS